MTRLVHIAQKGLKSILKTANVRTKMEQSKKKTKFEKKVKEIADKSDLDIDITEAELELIVAITFGCAIEALRDAQNGQSPKTPDQLKELVMAKVKKELEAFNYGLSKYLGKRVEPSKKVSKRNPYIEDSRECYSKDEE